MPHFNHHISASWWTWERVFGVIVLALLALAVFASL